MCAESGFLWNKTGESGHKQKLRVRIVLLFLLE